MLTGLLSFPVSLPARHQAVTVKLFLKQQEASKHLIPIWCSRRTKVQSQQLSPHHTLPQSVRLKTEQGMPV